MASNEPVMAEPRRVWLNGQYAIIPTVIGFDLEAPGEAVILSHPELAALRAWKARAVPLLKQLRFEMTGGDGDHIWCMHDECRAFGHDGDVLQHSDGCPMIEVDALLAESEASE